MLLNSDINPEWEPRDVALFVGLVGRIQESIRQTVCAHVRSPGEEKVQDLIAEALLVAFKSEHMFHGLRRADLNLAFVECEARLRAGIVDLGRVKRDLIASLYVEGRS